MSVCVMCGEPHDDPGYTCPGCRPGPGEIRSFRSGREVRQRHITPNDLFEAARRNSTVAIYLEQWRMGHLTFEQALMFAVVELAGQNERLAQSTQLQIQPAPIHLHGADAIAMFRCLAGIQRQKAVAKEREACAKIAERVSITVPQNDVTAALAVAIAREIRDRGNDQPEEKEA